MQGKYLQACLLLCVMSFSGGQQIFQKKGDNYHAKVAIRRYDPSSPNVQSSLHKRRKHAWRQGDRITKQEVIQNLANALLARKMTLDKLVEEEKQNNKENLHEYALYQAKLAKEEEEYAQHHPPRDNRIVAYPGTLSQIDKSKISSRVNQKLMEIGHVQQNPGNHPSRQYNPGRQQRQHQPPPPFKFSRVK